MGVSNESEVGFLALYVATVAGDVTDEETKVIG